MRQKLINTYKFNELNKEIQKDYIQAYLDSNTEKIVNDLAVRFFSR